MLFGCSFSLCCFASLLHLYISYEKSGDKLLKYEANSSCVIVSLILLTTLILLNIDITRRNVMLIIFRAQGLQKDTERH